MQRYPPRDCARDVSTIIPNLRAACTIRHTLADRVAFLTGACPPSPAIQSRMLRTIAHDLRELGGLLDQIEYHIAQHSTTAIERPTHHASHASHAGGMRGGAR